MDRYLKIMILGVMLLKTDFGSGGVTGQNPPSFKKNTVRCFPARVLVDYHDSINRVRLQSSRIDTQINKAIRTIDSLKHTL